MSGGLLTGPGKEVFDLPRSQEKEDIRWRALEIRGHGALVRHANADGALAVGVPVPGEQNVFQG